MTTTIAQINTSANPAFVEFDTNAGVIYDTLALAGPIPAPIAADVSRAGIVFDIFAVPAGVSRMLLKVYPPAIAQMPASGATPVVSGIDVVDSTVGPSPLPINADGTYSVVPGHSMLIAGILLNVFSSDLAGATINVGDWVVPYSRSFT